VNSTAKRIAPDDFILSILSPKDRLEAAFKIAGEAFRKKTLTAGDVEKAIEIVRSKGYAKKK